MDRNFSFGTKRKIKSINKCTKHCKIMANEVTNYKNKINDDSLNYDCIMVEILFHL